jgi:hypothetical protein
MDELYADIGIGKRMPALVTRRIFGLIEGESDTVPSNLPLAADIDPITIYGSEDVSVQLPPAACQSQATTSRARCGATKTWSCTPAIECRRNPAFPC